MRPGTDVFVGRLAAPFLLVVVGIGAEPAGRAAERARLRTDPDDGSPDDHALLMTWPAVESFLTALRAALRPPVPVPD
ncbi:hypothetical protein AB0442_04430 [Kitasatospora sp. NPDC085895]|uniref:hypothetical protein n=1 Tax=Kitasatospora sp. NPDC085895 TaxID=3155057 RepID=UPI0034509BFC